MIQQQVSSLHSYLLPIWLHFGSGSNIHFLNSGVAIFSISFIFYCHSVHNDFENSSVKVMFDLVVFDLVVFDLLASELLREPNNLKICIDLRGRAHCTCLCEMVALHISKLASISNKLYSGRLLFHFSYLSRMMPNFLKVYRSSQIMTPSESSYLE